MSDNPSRRVWFLEGYLGDDRALRRWMIERQPYAIGRLPAMDLPLPFPSVSGRHAELLLRDDGLVVRDLRSTNGTFVNRRRIAGEAPLEDGDVLHVAECEFRVGCHETRVTSDLATLDSATMHAAFSESNLPGQMALGVREFRTMLLSGAVAPVFQPIVDLRDGGTVGYEALGRGSLDGLPTSPGELFRIAASLGLEAELSRLFRRRGVEEARVLRNRAKVFVNTHPAELDTPELMTSLEALRRQDPQMPVVLEIHEGAVADLDRMRELRAQLAALDIELAYDDFGAGQARLLELVEAPPHYLKFDLRLVRGLHEAPASKLNMVTSLVHVAADIGVLCLAEGVETDEDARACRGLGFRWAQGYYFGRPAALPDPRPD